MPPQVRSFAIDLLRALAIIMMIVYHAAFDLQMFHGWGIDVFATHWKIFERATASLFLLLVGYCFVLSWNRNPSFNKFFKRGFTILLFGFVVTIATYIFDKETFVRFGILHLIGISTFILPFFTRFRGWNVITGIIALALGAFMPSPTFRSVDYFPLFPWLGVILLGMALSYLLPPAKLPVLQKQAPRNAFGHSIEYISRHSLIIYMLHQPAILILLWIIFGKPIE